MKKLSPFFIPLFICIAANTFCFKSLAAPSAKTSQYFELKVYHFANSQQETTIDSFLQYSFLPSMHAAGISNIGTFKPIGNDTATDKRIYVFIPFESLKQWEKFSQQDQKNEGENTGGQYNDAPYDKPAYSRIETIFLRAFELMPQLTASKLSAAKSERVYELRSYESAGENIYRNKIQMFNQGGELDIFSRLGFNPVFYGEVIFGAKMPNLMYMTSFKNMQSRDEHWKSFGSDAAWKTLSTRKEYQNNVQHIDIVFLRPTNYSDL